VGGGRRGLIGLGLAALVAGGFSAVGTPDAKAAGGLRRRRNSRNQSTSTAAR